MSDRIISRPSSEAYRRNFPWPEKRKPVKDGDRFMFNGMECVVDQKFCEYAGFPIVFVSREDRERWLHGSWDASPDSEGGETD
jgi:hypothetical protein